MCTVYSLVEIIYIYLCILKTFIPFVCIETRFYRYPCNRNVDFCDRIRGFDIELLKKFSVKRIFDLMIENKKVKFGIQYVAIF